MENIEEYIPKDAEKTLIFFVNGKKVVENSPNPQWTLLWYLRNKLHLMGTKYGCGEGGCGACTVMLSQYIVDEERIKHISVNACLTPVCALHGISVTTVEGIGSTENKLHAVQERIAKAHGSQCGFCTPGIVMSVYSLLRSKQNVKYPDIELALQGNLCRCTGYRPIIETLKTFTESWMKQQSTDDKSGENVCLSANCCKNKKEQCSKLYVESSFLPYDPSQEPIFPPELKLNPKNYHKYLYYNCGGLVWIQPKNLDDVLLLKHRFRDSKIIAGNTEIGIETKFKKKCYPLLISLSLLPDLGEITVSEQGLVIGSCVSLTELNNFLHKAIEEYYKKSKVFKALRSMLRWFAGNQIRNVATLTGNLVTASPISDINPILMASSSIVNVKSLTDGTKKIAINEEFFRSYRKTAIKSDQLIVSIEVPFSVEKQYFKAYKVSKRKDDDISIVTAAFSVVFEANDKIKCADLCYGGMCETTICSKESSEIMKGMSWDQQMLIKVLDIINKEFDLSISTPGGMPLFRKSLALSLFFRFYLYVLYKRKNKDLSSLHCVDQCFSGVNEFKPVEPTMSQYFEVFSDEMKQNVIGKPITHISALKQVTGEAIYCDDKKPCEGELHLCLLFSSYPYAKIISVDTKRALNCPGVTAFFTAKDLSEKQNKYGPLMKDEEIFFSQIVTSRACVIGAVVATSEEVARLARDLIEVKYEPLKPVIITIEDAIKHESYFENYPRTLRRGNIDDAFSDSSHAVEGYVRTGAQEHFYLETISAYAVRNEDELEIVTTTQSPSDLSFIISEALGIANSKVTTKVRRLGGAFGGKETRTSILAVPVAIAAYKLKKPVRSVLEREEDMQVTGYRHPCLIKYKASFDESGKILAAKYDLYFNAGNSMDISCSMLERAIHHVDNCYNIPNIEINGYLCKTNLPSNTAFRGFGAPKAMLATENLIRDIASVLNETYEEIVEVNMYYEGCMTYYGQTLSRCTISRCWHECIEVSNYWKRKDEIATFNKSHKWKKKGISIVPTKYGISFQTDVLMQAGVLLLIYKDGSVLLTIGGVEMGQGLYTKMIQIASKMLNIDIEMIHISETATDKVPNSSPTAASISSDLYGMSVINACKILNDRLMPYKIKKPDCGWKEWIMAAYCDRVSLSATGFYSAPKIKYDKNTCTGELYEYFTCGVACSEVIIDCLTGDHQVIRTDIVMDVGESLNPAIDIGQIEGAFMQGYGFCTMEEMVFSPTGEILSRGPGTYKIPGFSDIPKNFNVYLLKGAPNPRAVFSSKAVGEPPLFLAASVFFAIKEAIKEARIGEGKSSNFLLDLPATCAKIRMACEDVITDMVMPTVNMDSTPWNVKA